jgi:hypothetical protein
VSFEMSDNLNNQTPVYPSVPPGYPMPQIMPPLMPPSMPHVMPPSMPHMMPSMPPMMMMPSVSYSPYGMPMMYYNPTPHMFYPPPLQPMVPPTMPATTIRPPKAPRTAEPAEEDSEYKPKNQRKLHACNICGREYSQSSHLARHRRTHEEGSRFKCPVEDCPMKFHRIDNMKAHVRSHANKTGADPEEAVRIACEAGAFRKVQSLYPPDELSQHTGVNYKHSKLQRTSKQSSRASSPEGRTKESSAEPERKKEASADVQEQKKSSVELVPQEQRTESNAEQNHTRESNLHQESKESRAEPNHKSTDSKNSTEPADADEHGW